MSEQKQTPLQHVFADECMFDPRTTAFMRVALDMLDTQTVDGRAVLSYLSDAKDPLANSITGHMLQSMLDHQRNYVFIDEIFMSYSETQGSRDAVADYVAADYGILGQNEDGQLMLSPTTKLMEALRRMVQDKYEEDLKAELTLIRDTEPLSVDVTRN